MHGQGTICIAAARHSLSGFSTNDCTALNAALTAAGVTWTPFCSATAPVPAPELGLSVPVFYSCYVLSTAQTYGAKLNQIWNLSPPNQAPNAMFSTQLQADYKSAEKLGGKPLVRVLWVWFQVSGALMPKGASNAVNQWWMHWYAANAAVAPPPPGASLCQVQQPCAPALRPAGA